MRKKKGNVLDIGIGMIAVFIFVLVAMIADYTFGQFSVKWQNITSVNSSLAAVNVVKDTKTIMDTRLDYGGFVILIGIALGIIITGWLTPVHSIFAFVYFIVLMIIVAASAIISFTYGKITDSPALSTIVGNFPIMNHVLDNFPMYITIIGFIGMFVMFSKSQQ